MASSSSTTDARLANNNTLRVYYELDESMMRAHRDDRDEYAESTARILLSNDDLPLLIRARACMILACSNDSDYLDMAHEGVRIAKMIHEIAQGPVEERILSSAEKVLQESRERKEAEGEVEEDTEGLELVWQAGEDPEPKKKEKEKEGEEVRPVQEEGAKSEGAVRALGQPTGGKSNVSRLKTDPEKMTDRFGTPSSPPRLARKSERAGQPEESTEKKDDEDVEMHDQ